MSFLKSLGYFILDIIKFIIWFVNSPAFIVLLCLTALFVLLKIYLKIRSIMLRNIVYKREFSESGVYEGDTVIMTETIRNTGFFPLFWVGVEAYFYSELQLNDNKNFKRSEMQHFVSSFNLMPYMQICRRYTITCKARGYYHLKTASIYRKSGDLLLNSPAEIYVYPKPCSLDIYDNATGQFQSELLSRRRIFNDPFSFTGIRDYHFGDSMSLINFKASAKLPMGINSGAPFKINNRDFCANRRLMIFMDFCQPLDVVMDGNEYNCLIEKGLSYASDIVSNAIYEGFSVGFTANCRGVDGSFFLQLDCESGEAHMLDILKAMALIGSRDGAAFASLLKKEVESGVSYTEYAIFCFGINEDTASQINALESIGNTVKIITLCNKNEGTDDEY